MLAGILIFVIMLLVGGAIAANVAFTGNGTNGGHVYLGNTDLNDPAWGNKLESVGACLWQMS